MQIYLRQTGRKDIPRLMEIINEAKQFLKSYGNPQWQDGHPNTQMIEHDIKRQEGWGLMADGQLVGMATLQLGKDPTYAQIYDGHWHNPNAPYATIHRIAISTKIRGQHLGQFLLSNLLTIGVNQGLKNFRYDTHQVNRPMQQLGIKMGFQRRGTIYVKDKIDPKLMAFELNLA